ncbi:DUF3413 domain-containing protein [Vibrio sp. SS-MA-C1-2]|uniref:DUF3413 domain-containing protein n=1 Tax=Vibrio sp. SS-MA-C1-2 TaxID=2908646 RepID=UPI001F454E24|nr:DUF3413 domain-containing protein [Vibrio sp. SS-MA-C1-2]UJF19861.1 DUF3413 domain-containing protein [Vibrio sp. SS-MA-C1-2]
MVAHPTPYKDKVSRLISWGHWFAFFNIIITMLLGTRYIIGSEWPATFLGQFYLIISWFGHFSFLTFAIYILIIFPATFLLPSQRLLRLFSVFIATLGATALLLDSYTYNTLHLHLSMIVWDLLNSGENTAQNSNWQLIFIAVPIIFIVQLVLSEWVWRKQRKLSAKHIGGTLTIILGICFATSHIIHIWADANLYRPITVQKSTFPLSYPMTAKSFMERHGLLNKTEYLEREAKQGSIDSEKMNYPLTRLSFNDQGVKKNLLIIMVDSLRSDAISSFITPNLNSFAAENINYTQHFSASNSNQAGVFSLFYGLPPTYMESSKADNLTPVLIQTLHKRNYQFGLFSGDGFDDSVYPTAIFNHKELVQSSTEEKTEKPNTQQFNDTMAIDDWKSWLTQQKENKWFGYIDLKTVSHYDDQSSSTDTISGNSQSSTTAKLKEHYLKAVSTVDNDFQQIIDTLKSQGQFENTIIVVTSNHGIEFNDTKSNSWGSKGNYSRYQIQVPMMIHWPNQQPQVVTRRTSHLDLVPTLMENMFHTSSSSRNYSSGVNLFNSNSERPWLLAGDKKDIAVLAEDKTTVVDQYGNYKVYDQNFQQLKDEKTKLSTLLQVIQELKRFYHSEK